MEERIQKILSARGVASRRQAEQMILDGRVSCNGTTCILGQCADPDVDCILVDGKRLPSPCNKLYIIINKPKGYVTTLSDEKGRKNVAMLVSNCGERVYPVGRLDKDSEGLLLFTNDGSFANFLMHPSHEVEKEYYVEVTGYTQAGFQKLLKPVVLDGYRIKPPIVKLEYVDSNKAGFRIIIHEGRNRQVRRMCALAEMQVKRLVRIREGNVCLGDLPSGKWRFLREEELRGLHYE